MIVKLNQIKTMYINLEKDIDKKNNVESILNNLGFKDVIRINAFEPQIDKFVSERKNLGNIYGCALSHEHALGLNSAPFIILEDDIESLNYVNEIEVPDDADAVYLGNMCWGLIGFDGVPNSLIYEKVEGYKDVYRIFNLLGAHAILYLSEKYVTACLDSLTESYKDIDVMKDDVNPSTIASDVSFARIQKDYKVYTIGMPTFYQTGFYENDTNKHIEDYGK
jgi:cation transport regulator ChaB